MSTGQFGQVISDPAHRHRCMGAAIAVAVSVLTACATSPTTEKPTAVRSAPSERSPPPLNSPAVDTTSESLESPAAPSETGAASLRRRSVSACRVSNLERMHGAGRALLCEGYNLQFTQYDRKEVGTRDVRELLNQAVASSGKPAGEAVWQVAGRDVDVRLYDAPMMRGAVTIISTDYAYWSMHCLGFEDVGKGVCIEAFEEVLRDGLPAISRADGMTATIAGRTVKLPSGCAPIGDDGVKCNNGQLSWHKLVSKESSDEKVISEAERMSQIATNREGSTLVDKKYRCRFVGLPADCRQLDMDWGKVFKVIRVFLVSSATEDDYGLFAACSYYPDKEEGGKVPEPCREVFAPATGSPVR